MIRLLFITLLFVSFTFAQKVLHVSTIPSNADIYVQNKTPDHTKNPDFVSPAFITLNDSNEILISLFHIEFADTTIKVKLSKKDTSFLIVSERPILSDSLLQMQERALFNRSRKNWAKRIMFASILPFTAGVISGIVAYYEIDKADDCKKQLKNSAIKNADNYKNVKSDFDDYKSRAKTAKKISIPMLATGATLFSVGFILTF